MICLRRATPADIPLLKFWDTQPHIIETVCGDDGGWPWDVEIPVTVPWREQLFAEEDGRPVGFMQIIDPAEEEAHYWGDIDRIFALSISGSARRAILDADSAHK